MSKVTDRLIETGRVAAHGDGEQAARSCYGELLERHIAVSRRPRRTAPRSRARRAPDGRFRGADRKRCARWAARARSVAAVARRARRDGRAGEQPHRRRRRSPTQGIPAAWVDARRVLVTDAEHTAAVPDMDATCGAHGELVAPRDARPVRSPSSAASSARPRQASRRRSAEGDRTTRRRSSARASTWTRFRFGPTSTAC